MSISIFIKLLKDNNITKINAVDYMPIRYKAKEKAIMKKVGKLKGKVSFDEFNKTIFVANKYKCFDIFMMFNNFFLCKRLRDITI